jgi:hypothetical protein
MRARATGRFTIYRGTSTNDSGDTVDGDYIVASDVILGLRNTTVTEGDPTTATPRVIKFIRGTATTGTDLRAQDRIKNQETGIRYVIDTVEEGLSSTRNHDLRFEAHRVN